MKSRLSLWFALACLSLIWVLPSPAATPTGRTSAVPTVYSGARIFADGGGEALPEIEGTESASIVLWNQVPSAVNANSYVDQEFPDYAVSSSYLADDFTNAAPWTLRSIYTPGDGWNGFTTLANATSLTWAIYADDWGYPAGYPGAGASPVWTLTLPPGDPQVTLTNGNAGFPSNVMLNLTAPVSLSSGTWWLVFYPTLSFSTGGQYGRRVADTTSGAHALFINPGGGFGFGTSWSSIGILGPTQYDLAFRLEGQLCTSTIPITVASLGGTTADWPVIHGSQTGRMIRSGTASTCAAPKACPGVFDTTARAYDAFSFANVGCSATCVTATLSTACTGTNMLFAVAYLGAFTPANLCTNYLADLGSSPTGTPLNMSFTVPAGATFTLVVHEVTAGAGCAAGYTLTVDGLPCPPIPSTPTSLAAAGTCAGVMLYWGASPSATMYSLHRGASCGATNLTITGYMTSPYEDTYYVDPGQTYTYWIYAISPCGQSGPSTCVTGARQSAAAVGDTMHLAKVGVNLQLTWTNVPGATSYRVYQDTSPNGSFAGLLGSATSGAPGLAVPMPAQNILFFKVAALNSCGVGPMVVGGPDTEVWVTGAE